MEQSKIGRFIAESRKAAGLTQEKLGEKLGVSKNAVSKWERGLNLPDASIMQGLCAILGCSLNELFAGERLQGEEIQSRADENILNVIAYGSGRRRRYRLALALISCLLIICVFFLARTVLIELGCIADDELACSQLYLAGEESVRGEVDATEFGKIHIDFDVGANKYGYAVFKDPGKAFRRLKSDYAQGVELIRDEFDLPPLNNITRNAYKIYGWQVTGGTAAEREQARFVTSFLDVYENSFR